MDRITSTGLSKYKGFNTGSVLPGKRKKNTTVGEAFVSGSQQKDETGLISPDILKRKSSSPTSVKPETTGIKYKEKADTKASHCETKTPESSISGKPSKIYEPSLYKKFTARSKHVLKQILAVTMLAGALSAGPVSAAAATVEGEKNRPVIEQVEDGNKNRLNTLVQKAEEVGERFEVIGDRFDDINRMQRKIGDYDLKVKFMDPSIDIKPRLNPKIKDGELQLKGKAYIKAEMDLLETELSKQRQQGDWTITHGLRGKIDSEYRFGYSGKWSHSQGSFDEENIDETRFSAHLHGFKRWDKDLSGDRHLRLDVSAGVSHNILDDQTTLNIKGEQELTGKRVQIFGHTFRWLAEAEEEIRYNIQDDEFDAKYEVMAGIGKKVPVKVLGHEIDIDFKIGPGIKGDIDSPLDFKPLAKLKALF